MDFSRVSAEGRRLAGMVRRHLDDLFPVVDFQNTPPSTNEYDRHVWCKRRIDGDSAERLRIVNDAVFMGCMKDRVETVVLDDTLALATEQERTVRCLLDQCGVGVAKLAQEPAEQTARNGPRSQRVAKSRWADAPPRSAITERI